MQQANTANLHEMTDQLGGGTQKARPIAIPSNAHDIVGDQTMTPAHEFQGAFALADAAGASQEHTHPHDVDQGSMYLDFQNYPQTLLA